MRPDDPPPLPWPRWAEIVAVVGAWSLFVSVTLVARALNDDISFTLHTVGVTLAEAAPWLLAAPVVFVLAARWPPVGTGWPRRLAVHVGAAVGLVLLVGAVQSAGVAAMGPPPRFAASSGPASPPPGPPGDGRPPHPPTAGLRPPALWTPSLNGLLYLAILGVGLARAAAIKAATRRAEAERAEAERALAEAERQRLAAQVTEARLDALRMQLRPHFLFNALNAVAALAGDDPAEVRRIVARLSSLLRRVLDADARPLVPLRDELAFARDYLDLQRVRFDRLDVDEAVDASLLDAEVPTLVLQPLVENAVEHGAAARGGGHVWIGARHDGRRLVLTVGDDGPGLAAQPASDHRSVGLANTRARLAAHYGEAADVVLRPRAGGGAEAVVTIPLDDDDL